MLGAEATNRIKAAYGEMPAQMRLAARFVLDHPQDVVLLSMRALARRAGVPAATMTRMAQRVGFAGFDDLRAVYLNDARAAPDWFSSKAQGMLNRRDEMGEPALVGDLAQNLAGNTAALASEEARRAIARASDLLMAAERIFCVGARSAYPVSFIFSYVLGYFWPGGKIVGGSRGDVDFDSMFDITAADAVLAASFNPYARTTVDAVGIAAEAGATIVSITDSEMEGIGPLSNVVIPVAKDSPSFFDTMTPAFAAAEILAATMAGRIGPDVMSRVRRREERLAALSVWSGVLGREPPEAPED